MIFLVLYNHSSYLKKNRGNVIEKNTVQRNLKKSKKKTLTEFSVIFYNNFDIILNMKVFSLY